MGQENRGELHKDVEKEEVVKQVTTVKSGQMDQHSRRRFILKGSKIIAGAFGAIPLMRLAKIDVATTARAASPDEYLGELETKLGDREAAERMMRDLRLDDQEGPGPEPGRKGTPVCGCGCSCNCPCRCDCNCQCEGDTCSCICSCECECDCGCNCFCRCGGTCTCKCGTNPGNSTASSNSHAGFQRTSGGAVDATVKGTSETNVVNNFQIRNGQSTTESGHNNNALMRTEAPVAGAVSAQNVSDGNSAAVSTNDANDEDAQFSKQETNQAALTTVPGASTTATILVALGIAGAGWHYLRRQAAAGGSGGEPQGA